MIKVIKAITNKTTFFFWVMVAFIYVLAWLMQDTMLFKDDNSVLLYDTQHLLAGGTYIKNFFEPTAPMIFYLYIPPVLLTTFLSIPLMLSFRIYIFLLTFIILSLCLTLGKKIFSSQDKKISILFFLTLITTFLLVPVNEFGQREHLFFIFSLPYLLAVTIRLENKSLPNALAITIGLLAGLGFAIKPFFIFTPLCLAVYLSFYKRKMLAFLYPETITAFATLFICTIIVFARHPDYFQVIVPFAMRVYYQGLAVPWSMLLLCRASLFCYLAILLYLASRRVLTPYRTLSAVLCVSLTSFFFTFFCQRVLFYYHMLPMLSMVIILSMSILLLMIFSSRKSPNKLSNDKLSHFLTTGALVTLSLILFILPMHTLYVGYKEMVEYKQSVLPLTDYLRAHMRHRSVYLFAEKATPFIPAINIAEVDNVSRFPAFWMLRGLEKLAMVNHNLSQQGNADKNMLMDMVTEDLNQKKPEFVMIDLMHNSNVIPQNFNYLTYFDSVAFKQAWQHYHYVTTIPNAVNADSAYCYAIYQRDA